MRKNGAGASLIRVIAPVVFLCSSGVSSAASLVVTTTADSGPGSLRSAISQADATSDAAISFSIPSSAASATGVVTISPVSALPILTGAGTVIDGTTQQIPAGTARNGQAVVINGSNAGVSSGLVVEAAHCLIKGLAISGFSAAGIELSGSSANNDTVQFCYLGTDPTGISAAPNGEWGIGVYDGAHNNVIGGNIISGNTQDGVLITDTSTSQNIFVSNLIGVDATGRKALPNGGAGVVFDNSATSNTIGGAYAGAGNVISGNVANGILIGHTGTSNNLIQGNAIGTTLLGDLAVPNGQNGIVFDTGASDNTVGGTTALAGNVISGNLANGIELAHAGTNGNTIQGNFIGTNSTATPGSGPSIPNGQNGITITTGAQNTVIGGIGAGAANIIAFNKADGVLISDVSTTGNSVRGNSIFGNTELSINLQPAGEPVGTPTPNHTGGAISGPNNLQNTPVISSAFNSGTAVTIIGSLNSDANTVFHLDFYRAPTPSTAGFGPATFYIGSTDVTTDAAGNTNFTFKSASPTPGVGITYTAAAVDGGTGDTSELARDVTSSSGPTAVITTTTDAGAGSLRSALVLAAGTPGTSILFNVPANDPGVQAGIAAFEPLSPLPAITANGTILDGSSESAFLGSTPTPLDYVPPVVINGSQAGANAIGLTLVASSCVVRNVSVNSFSSVGIYINGPAATGNQVANCYVGLTPDGTGADPNGASGIVVDGGAANNKIGGPTPAERNIISGNAGSGVLILHAGTTGNLILSNFIGTNASGTLPVPNGANGVLFETGAEGNTVGGPGTLAGGPSNLIAFNLGDGIQVDGTTTIGNTFRGNVFFENRLLSINLQIPGEGSGMTNPNHTGSASGPNDLQNYPVITTVTPTDNTTTVAGTLNSLPSTSFVIDVYNGTGNGTAGLSAAQTMVGSTSVTTDATGTATVNVSTAGSLPNLFFTAVATNTATGDTSEMSLPASANGPAYIFPRGISMASIPYLYSGTRATAAELFEIPVGTDGSALVAAFDPVGYRYLIYPNLPGPSATMTQPGEGFWIKEAAEQPFLDSGTTVPTPFEQPALPGWNLIGDPFTSRVALSDIQVKAQVAVDGTAAGTLMPFATAQTQQVIGPTVWTYDTAQGTMDAATTLLPFQGYWLYVLPTGSGGQSITLHYSILEVVDQPGKERR